MITQNKIKQAGMNSSDAMLPVLFIPVSAFTHIFK